MFKGRSTHGAQEIPTITSLPPFVLSRTSLLSIMTPPTVPAFIIRVLWGFLFTSHVWCPEFLLCYYLEIPFRMLWRLAPYARCGPLALIFWTADDLFTILRVFKILTNLLLFGANVTTENQLRNSQHFPTGISFFTVVVFVFLPHHLYDIFGR